MHWAIYAFDGFEGAAAFRSGLLDLGHRATIRSLWDYNDSCVESTFDVVVTFGLQGKGGRILREYRSAGTPVVVIDFGYIKRTNHAHDHKTGHWQVSVGGLNQIPKFSCPPDRFESLQVPISDRGGDPNGYTLLCVQTPGDASHGMDKETLGRWCREQASRWPNLVIRPHPLAADQHYGLPVCKADSLAGALSGARLVVTANSNAGHDALIAGVPIVSTMPGAAWESLSGKSLPHINARRDHFVRCAYGQWTWNEFRKGLPQKFLIDHQFNFET